MTIAPIIDKLTPSERLAFLYPGLVDDHAISLLVLHAYESGAVLVHASNPLYPFTTIQLPRGTYTIISGSPDDVQPEPPRQPKERQAANQKPTNRQRSRWRQ